MLSPPPREALSFFARSAKRGAIACAVILIFLISILDIAVGDTYAQTRVGSKYTDFRHSTKAHTRECASCHKFPSSNWKSVRKADTAIPDITEYPSHDSCVNCHKQQFFRGARPAICSICHVAATPKNGRRHPFQNPIEAFESSAKSKGHSSDFQIRFPHASHIEIVSGHASPVTFRRASFSKRAAEESCAVCHKTVEPQGDGSEEFLKKPPANIGDAFWLKKGTFKGGPNGHTTCFACHSADTGIAPAQENCASCHSLKTTSLASDLVLARASLMTDSKRMLDRWARRSSSGTYRHEFFAHNDLSCSTCHTVSEMNTLDAASRRVPISSCATCHVTATADDGGALNYEVEARKKTASFKCTKCHLAFGKQPVPKSHLDAIVAAGGKP